MVVWREREGKSWEVDENINGKVILRKVKIEYHISRNFLCHNLFSNKS